MTTVTQYGNGRRCSKCGIEKPREEFYADNRLKDGLQSQCKPCNRAYPRNLDLRKAWYQEHRDISIERAKAVRATERGKLCHYRGSAKARGLEFGLTKLPPYPGVCPITGHAPTGVGRDVWHLDRVNNSRGYIDGNVRWLSARGNILKADMDLKTAKRLVAYLSGED